MGSVLREYNTLVYSAWETDAKPFWWLKVSNLEARDATGEKSLIWQKNLQNDDLFQNNSRLIFHTCMARMCVSFERIVFVSKL